MPPTDRADRADRATAKAKTNADRLETALAAAQLSGACLRVIVGPAGGKGGGGTVLEKLLDPDEGWRARDVALEIVAAAQDDAEGHGGVQRYKVAIWNSEDESREIASCTIRCSGGEGAAPTDGSPSQVIGLLTKLVDNSNRLVADMAGNQAKTFQAIFDGLQKSYGSQLDARDKRIEHLESKQAEAMAMLEDLLEARQQKELERTAAAASEARKDKAFTAFLPLAPTIINRVMGRAIIPESIAAAVAKAGQEANGSAPASSAPAVAGLQELRASMDADQTAKLKTIFRPDQMTIFDRVTSQGAALANPDTVADLVRLFDSLDGDQSEQLQTVFRTEQLVLLWSMVEAVSPPEKPAESAPADEKG